MKEYCLVGLYTNFDNFSQMCKFITLWSSTTILQVDQKYLNLILFSPKAHQYYRRKKLLFKVHICLNKHQHEPLAREGLIENLIY